MITLTAESVALLAAAVAIVAKSEDYKFNPSENGYGANLENIRESIGADYGQVYDHGGSRFLKFIFDIHDNHSALEVMVGPRPARLPTPTPDDTDPPPGGTPIALAA